MQGSNLHSVVVQNEHAFLLRLMVELAGNAIMSLEGNVFDLRFPQGFLLGTQETPLLKRVGRPSKQSMFLTLRLEAKFVSSIIAQIEDPKVFNGIWQVQIERNSIFELSAHDRFLYTTTGPGIGVALLQRLKDAKIISGFAPARDSQI